MNVLFKERSVPCRKKEMKDTFEAYTVYIYSNVKLLPTPLKPITSAAREYAQGAIKLKKVIAEGMISHE